MTPPITEFQRRVLLALIDMEAARKGMTRRERQKWRHRLFALVREWYGCKYSILPYNHFEEAALRLLRKPLN